MAEKGYYYNKAKELVEREFAIDMLVIEEDLTSIENVYLYLVDFIDTLETDSDEAGDRERNQLFREVHRYVKKEHGKEIEHAKRVKALFEIMSAAPQVMENFNNNPWDFLEELNEHTTDKELTTLEKFFLPQEF